MKVSDLIGLVTVILTAMTAAQAQQTIGIPSTEQVPMFDGQCLAQEWQSAKKIELPANTAIYLMHDHSSLYVCAKGKSEDYTVIDLYIVNNKTGQWHNLHASAQLSERLKENDDWTEPKWWHQQGWTGYWVPYAGEKDTDKGPQTQFLTGSHREIQILKSKFTGQDWTMMIGISAVYQDGEYGAEFFYPKQANLNDHTTWGRFTFAD